MDKRLIGEAEAAKYLGRSKTCFRAQVARKELPCETTRNGRARLWDVRILDRYVDALSGLDEKPNPWDGL